MDGPDIAEQLVQALDREDGSPDKRPVHAIGIGVSGYFDPSDVAGNFCTAAHFQERRSPVTVRFSNGSGAAAPHDGWSDVRGMATRFHLSDDIATDLIAMTLPEFFAPTPEAFWDFAKRAKPIPVEWESPWKKILALLRMTLPLPDPQPGEKISPNKGAIEFANEHKYAQLGVFQAASIGAPTSYVRATYHAVHTFIVTAPDEVDRWVRFTWQPISGVLTTDPTKLPVDEYLQDELRARLSKTPARFSLMMSIGETGDAFDDSTRPWPPHRMQVIMGTLTLTDVLPDQIADCEKLSFNPGLLTPGIRASNDPVLEVRKEAYSYSSARRTATPCPFSGSAAHGE